MPEPAIKATQIHSKLGKSDTVRLNFLERVCLAGICLPEMASDHRKLRISGDYSEVTKSSVLSDRAEIIAKMAVDLTISLYGHSPSNLDLDLVILSAALIRKVDNLIDRPGINSSDKKDLLMAYLEIIDTGLVPKQFNRGHEAPLAIASDIYYTLQFKDEDCRNYYLQQMKKLVEIETSCYGSYKIADRIKLGEQTFNAIFAAVVAVSKNSDTGIVKMARCSWGIAQVLGDLKERYEDQSNEILTFANINKNPFRISVSAITSKLHELIENFKIQGFKQSMKSLQFLMRFIIASAIAGKKKFDH